MTKHDHYGLAQAGLQATFSKDPGTKVGAAILRPDGTLASVGRNGFAKGVDDDPERLDDREVKLMLTLHAELNAILFAKEDLRGYTIYVTPFSPCAHCASAIIQAGIGRVVHPLFVAPDHWCKSFGLAYDIFREAGVHVTAY